MTSRDFCYWLQGYFEVHDAGNPPNVKIDKGLIGEKVETIKAHLAMVFKHEIDPSFGDKESQDALNKIHSKDKNIIVRC